MENERKRGVFGRLFLEGMTPVCPKCGHEGFIALLDDAIINADKPVAIITCNSKSCCAAIGVLPFSAVWDE